MINRLDWRTGNRNRNETIKILSFLLLGKSESIRADESHSFVPESMFPKHRVGGGVPSRCSDSKYIKSLPLRRLDVAPPDSKSGSFTSFRCLSFSKRSKFASQSRETGTTHTLVHINNHGLQQRSRQSAKPWLPRSYDVYARTGNFNETEGRFLFAGSLRQALDAGAVAI